MNAQGGLVVCCSSCAMRALEALYSSFCSNIFRGGRGGEEGDITIDNKEKNREVSSPKYYFTSIVMAAYVILNEQMRYFLIIYVILFDCVGGIENGIQNMQQSMHEGDAKRYFQG